MDIAYRKKLLWRGNVKIIIFEIVYKLKIRLIYTKGGYVSSDYRLWLKNGTINGSSFDDENLGSLSLNVQRN